jgi:hypothetical protein
MHLNKWQGDIMDYSFKNMIKPQQPEPPAAAQFIPEPTALTPMEVAEAQQIYQQAKTPQPQPMQAKQTKGWGAV